MCVGIEVRDKHALGLAGRGLQCFSLLIMSDMFVMKFPSPHFGPCFLLPEITLPLAPLHSTALWPFQLFPMAAHEVF